MFPQSSFVGLHRYTKLRAAPQAEAPGQVRRPPSQEVWGTRLCPRSAQHPEGDRLARTVSLVAPSHGTQESKPHFGPWSQAIKGCLLGSSHKKWETETEAKAPAIFKAFLRKTLALWSVAEGEHEDRPALSGPWKGL